MKIYKLSVLSSKKDIQKKYPTEYFADVAYAVQNRAWIFEAIKKEWRKQFKGTRARFTKKPVDFRKPPMTWQKQRLEYIARIGGVDCPLSSPWFLIEEIEVKE